MDNRNSLKNSNNSNGVVNIITLALAFVLIIVLFVTGAIRINANHLKKTEYNKTEQSKTEQSKTEQSKTEQSKTEQSKTEQSLSEDKMKHNKAKHSASKNKAKHSASKNKAKHNKKTLVIGDSRTVGVSSTGSSKDKFYWLCECAVSTNFITNDLKVTTGKVMRDTVKNTVSNSRNVDLVNAIKDKNIGNVIVALGVNSMSKSNAKNLSSKLKKLQSKTKANVYYSNIIPVVNKGKYKVTNSQAVEFNSEMQSYLKDSKVKIINAYNVVKSVHGYERETSDGLHYSTRVYKKILKKYKKIINKHSN